MCALKKFLIFDISDNISSIIVRNKIKYYINYKIIKFKITKICIYWRINIKQHKHSTTINISEKRNNTFFR